MLGKESAGPTGRLLRRQIRRHTGARYRQADGRALEPSNVSQPWYRCLAPNERACGPRRPPSRRPPHTQTHRKRGQAARTRTGARRTRPARAGGSGAGARRCTRRACGTARAHQQICDVRPVCARARLAQREQASARSPSCSTAPALRVEGRVEGRRGNDFELRARSGTSSRFPRLRAWRGRLDSTYDYRWLTMGHGKYMGCPLMRRRGRRACRRPSART
jgi:hypothetical protein